MKRIILFLTVVFALVGLAALTVRPMIRSFAQKELESTFTDAVVSIGECHLDPLHQLSFLNVRLKRDKIYDITVGEVSIHYGLSSLSKKRINSVKIKDVDVHIDLSQESILTYGQYLSLGEGGAFSLKTLSLSEARFDIRSKEFQVESLT